eukprot:Skav220631  [mRNA]  locus=scaffold112:332455:332730:+ [translate_table: standard]
MIGKADTEGSKSNVAMNGWMPQTTCPYSNFSDTSGWTKIHARVSQFLFVLKIKIKQNFPFWSTLTSVLIALTLGPLRYPLSFNKCAAAALY